MRSDGLLKVLYVVLIFLVGFIFGQVWDFYSGGGITGFAVDKPSDFLDNRNILIYPDKVVIKIAGAKLSSYDSTGSMLPTLGDGVNGISIEPESADEIEVGDIVSFWRGDDLIVHRVVEKGADEQGVYFVTKGDNSPVSDGKIRFEEIERVLVGVVY
ncbi:MAG: S26 family signal peptidase [Nanoarchaeota archaeon]|nr:S26 family signal peptidase [Nanoarchaeota archaeon]MBU1103506.1 S26 family signal peptidase [Nanoarchaeota archaeon]